MSPTPLAERRSHPRLAVFGGVRFQHPASRREIAGRLVDLSRGGLRMYVPPDAPLRAGQTIRLLDLPGRQHVCEGPSEASEDPLAPLDAVVIRVDRSALARDGKVAIAARFDQSLVT